MRFMRRNITTLITREAIRYHRRHISALTPLPSSLFHRNLLPRPLSTTAASRMSSSPSPSPSSSAAGISATPSATPPQNEQSSSEPKLPPLSPQEFREYNRMADHMDVFHNHFRSTWAMLYTSASSGKRAQGMSMRAFIAAGLEFVQHLEVHHSIEERFVFPDLAVRMPEFRTGKERNLPKPAVEEEEDEGKRRKKAAELLQQHVEIHKGMDGLADYLRRCLTGETELQMSVLKTQLDSWGTVLFNHLDQEVRTLGAENMRRYWTLDEVRRMRM